MNPYILFAMAALGIGGGFAILWREWRAEERRLRIVAAVAEYNRGLRIESDILRAKLAEVRRRIEEFEGAA